MAAGFAPDFEEVFFNQENDLGVHISEFLEARGCIKSFASNKFHTFEKFTNPEGELAVSLNPKKSLFTLRALA